MNDESSSAGPSSQYETENHNHEAATENAADISARRKKNRENFQKRRAELLDDLLRNVDLLVYAELSAIYYMDCSFLLFTFRAMIHLVFLTPKPSLFPDPPSHRPYVGFIFGNCLLCMLLHVWSAAPSAGEATRGYLHGGLMMDFIGQKGPTSKIHLLLLDLVSLGLQCVQLSVHALKIKLKQDADGPVSVTTTSGRSYAARAVSMQTVEDEERGVRGSEERRRTEDAGIEMQTLNAAGEHGGGTISEDREALLRSTTLPPKTDAHIFDAFNSGQIVLGDFNLLSTIKEQFWAYQKAPRDSNTTEQNRLMRERLAARISRWRFQPSAVAGRTLG